MDEFKDGLGDAGAAIALFVPKLLGFLLILVIGYFVAKAIEKVVGTLLERIGFDRWVERGGIKGALAKSKFDASSILARLVFFVIFLFVLQLAFGIFGDNPISDLIKSVIAYLPKVFVAIVILVVGSAIAAAVKEIVEAALGGLSYGRTLAFIASGAILVLAVFAALNQLEIAEEIVNGAYYALLAIIVGSAVVAIGGGGIQTMQRYWERSAQRLERESDRIKDEMEGADQRIQERAEVRKEQLKPSAGPATTADLGGSDTGTPPTAY
ncbi:MAG: hypothetical protein M3345_04855 [Actinomycetota bacterium]|nr:hypothetical protein [Actinomycetota bacterium]